jgi:hypothetical protein
MPAVQHLITVAHYKLTLSLYQQLLTYMICILLYCTVLYCVLCTQCILLQAECSALKGWALQQKEAQIAQAQKQLLQLPEDTTLADIEVRMREL